MVCDPLILNIFMDTTDKHHAGGGGGLGFARNIGMSHS